MLAALDNIANTSAAPKQSNVREARFAWDLLETAKAYSSPDHRVRTCASFTIGDDNRASVIKTPKGPRIQGLNACGAHHMCPRCVVAYRGKWVDSIRWLMTENSRRKRRAYFFTGTVPHHLGDPPGPMLTALSKAWNSSFSGRSRLQLRELGFAGYAKAIDYTVGGAGHHLHLHAILWFDRDLTPSELANLNAGLFGRWSRAVARVLGRECTRDAFYIEPVDDELAASDYVAKMCGVPYELTSSITKKGKGRTIWGVLRDMTSADEAHQADIIVWRQYVEAIKGKRGIELSREMHALLKERVAEDQPDAEVILTIPREVYRVLKRERWQGALVTILAHAKPEYVQSLQTFFDHAGAIPAIVEQTAIVKMAMEQ